MRGKQTMPEELSGQSEATRIACRQFDHDFSAYLEGEQKPELLGHARECPYCAALLADLEQIRFASHHLPLTDPPTRVWSNIRAMLEAEGLIREQVLAWHRWLPRLAFLPSSAPVGALACLAMLGVTLLLSPGNLENKAASPWVPSGGEMMAASILGPGLDSGLVRTLGEMEANYLAREGTLEPTTQATYRKSLDSLDACIRECLRHCQRAPGDALARQYLVRAYQTKAEVLASALEYNAR